jgi:hypothetical protein
MPSKKPTRQELGIPSAKQLDNSREIKRLAEVNKVLEAASRIERRRLRNTKETQTDPESCIEAEVVDSSDPEPEQHTRIRAEAVPAQGDAHNINRSFWVLAGIFLALWIRLLQ